MQLGERVAVVGLGLVGQLACRLLMAAGCEVVGIDLDAQLVDRARSSGVTAYRRDGIDPENPPADARECDAIIITAATGTNDPVRVAGALAQDRARVVVVGDVGMTLPRSSYYDKELELRLSRSYGPGRYDRSYEERGLDYPIGYVRWTERRNLSAFVAQLAEGRLSIEDLISARIPVEQAADAYERLVAEISSPLGLILVYGPTSLMPSAAPLPLRNADIRRGSTPTAGVIGAGSFAQRVLIPGLRDAGFQLTMIASASGLSAAAAAERFGFLRSASASEVIESAGLEALCIASRHGSHAEYAIRALQQGKAVFVEKPPATTPAQLDTLRDAARDRILQVGFNRRFAPLAEAMRQHVRSSGQPVELLYRVAAGRLPSDHWLNDPDDGGDGSSARAVISSILLVGSWETYRRMSRPAFPLVQSRSFSHSGSRSHSPSQTRLLLRFSTVQNRRLVSARSSSRHILPGAQRF